MRFFSCPWNSLNPFSGTTSWVVFCFSLEQNYRFKHLNNVLFLQLGMGWPSKTSNGLSFSLLCIKIIENNLLSWKQRVETTIPKNVNNYHLKYQRELYLMLALKYVEVNESQHFGSATLLWLTQYNQFI